MLRNIINTFFTKGFVAIISLGILLILSKQLGSEVVGQVSLLMLNITIIQSVSQIYTGPALVYFIPRHHLGPIYRSGFLWTLGCVTVLNLVFNVFDIGVRSLWIHVLLLSLLSTLHAFHCVILLARERIRTYNFLNFLQPGIVLLALSINVFGLGIYTVMAQVTALYVSFAVALLISTLRVIRAWNDMEETIPGKSNVSVFAKGFASQLGNLAHTLSNRYNYYVIAVSSLVGIYANATSLIESVLIIGSSISPVIFTHVANQRDFANNARLTLLLSRFSFLLSVFCVVIICFIPNSLFVYLLGEDFGSVKTLMLYLSPGILCVSFVSVISHYFSGLGVQKVQLAANCLGLLITLCLSRYLVNRFGLRGACFTASLAYFASALVFTTAFFKVNRFGFFSLFKIKGDLALLKRKA